MKYLLLVILVLIVGVVDASASHGGGTSGGCSGDCTPPTLGTDNAGKQLVKDGITINDESFDVTHYKQDVPTQIVSIGEPIIITATILENTGPQSLEYVGLSLGLKEELISGVRLPTHSAEIHWNRDDITIDDPSNFITNVNVTESILDKFNIVTFEFTPISEFDTDVIIIHTWDTNRNSWSNHFFNAIKIESDEITIPTWIKNNAKWWADGSINDDTFIQSIQYLIENNILNIPYTESESDIKEIPVWVKNNAKWWADGSINDDTFIQSIQYLITNGII